MTNSFAQGIAWDLSDLYASPADPRIFSDLKLAENKAVAFEATYKPLLERLPERGRFPLAPLLAAYKEIAALITKPCVFAQLAFAAKTNDPTLGAFLQKIQVTVTDIQSHLLFFEVTWNKLDKNTVEEWLKDPAIQEDLHFLEKMRCFAPYTLNEGEEKIMAAKANTGGQAFARLFDEVMNSVPFYTETDGKKTKKTEGEVLSLLHSPRREERKKASESLAEGLKSHTHLLTYTFNMILADHRSTMKIRGYRHPMDAMNLSNEIELESVLNLIQSVQEAYPTVQRYYRLKQKLLGFEKLYDYDRYAPVEAEDACVDFARCREMVLDGYDEFSPQVRQTLEPFFTKSWIDAEIREGKQGGGFCCQTTPDLHPYILVNYTGSLRDVMTVAHELGHGLHQMLARKAGILESHAPLTLAETASVFGEMLIFEKILKGEENPAKRLALLCGKIDDHIATVFRQIALTDFELKAHELGLVEGELAAEKLSDLWTQSSLDMMGDSVELTPNHRHGWKYIPHFIHTPFYCYAYAFAQLFVLSLYELYKKERASFVGRFLEMLSLGGSKRPETIASIVGVNLNDPALWRSGLGLLDRLVREAEELAYATA